MAERTGTDHRTTYIVDSVDVSTFLNQQLHYLEVVAGSCAVHSCWTILIWTWSMNIIKDKSKMPTTQSPQYKSIFFEPTVISKKIGFMIDAIIDGQNQ